MKINLSIILLILILLSGCLDTISVELPSDNAGRTVIDGVVERSQDIYRFFVRVTSTRDLSTDLIENEVSADIELVFNGEGVAHLTNGSEERIPIMQFHQLYGGNPEDAMFNIRVSTQEGRVFESDPQKILKGPTGGTIQLNYDLRAELNDVENVVNKGYVKVKIVTPIVNDQQDRVSFRWDVSGVYRFPEVAWTDDPFFFPKTCYVRDFLPVNKVNVLKSSNVNGDFVDGYDIGELEADHRFSSGYYFTVIQRSINEGAAIYWDQVRQSINRAGTIFDSPVGAVNSNIRQVSGNPVEVLGYFYTAGIDTLRHLSTRDETGNQRHLCALQAVSEVCCNCLEIVNSSLIKPIYWE